MGPYKKENLQNLADLPRYYKYTFSYIFTDSKYFIPHQADSFPLNPGL